MPESKKVDETEKILKSIPIKGRNKKLASYHKQQRSNIVESHSCSAKRKSKHFILEANKYIVKCVKAGFFSHMNWIIKVEDTQFFAEKQNKTVLYANMAKEEETKTLERVHMCR